VDRADAFGLSQLHQLRGRVGRGRERAYSYFLYSPDKPLTEVAHDRLTTIATNTDLGSGMQVALKDLEIRGAGNMLGGEQSGHIAEVGFDLYMRMVGEAVEDFKVGYVDVNPRIKECKVELPITAHLPVEYVPSERLRLDLYRRMADCSDDAGLNAIVEELVDRFGELPEPAQSLIEVARIRTLAKAKGLAPEEPDSRTVEVEAFCSWSACRMKMRSSARDSTGLTLYSSQGTAKHMRRKFDV